MVGAEKSSSVCYNFINKSNYRESDKMILGLTGGIASGKSTVSSFLKEIGIEIIDADNLAREVSERSEVIDELVKTFGEEILEKKSLDKQGRRKIERKSLREIVFSNKENVKKINKIIHPRVIEVFEKRKKTNLLDEIIIFDIPLLFEANLEYLCDKVIVVVASEKIQIERIKKRDGSGLEVAKNIIGNQMSSNEKSRLADYVITNDKSIEELKNQVVELYERIKGELY